MEMFTQRALLTFAALAVVETCGTVPWESVQAAETCQTPKMRGAESTVNRMAATMIENAPVECKLMPEKGGAQCSFLCMSTYTMADSQRTAALVYLVGITGLQMNQLGVSRFKKVMYLDRGTAHDGFGMSISADDAAGLQRQVKSDQITAKQFLAGVLQAFHRVSTKK